MNEIKLGKANYILHQYDSSPINLYIKINDLNEIENDITINIKIEGLDVYKSYNISITGYFSFSKHLNIDLNNIKKYAISKGFYDNITNIGIIKFKSKSMKTYYSNNNVNLLIINLKDLNYNKNQFIDVMIKATPLPNQILLKENFNLIDDNYEFPIPQFEHFISYIDLSNYKYMIYKLDTMNEKNKYINVELHFLYNETEFCFHVENSNLFPNSPNFYKNDSNDKFFLIIDERNKNGKKSIVIKVNRRFKEIYLIIFIKKKIKNKHRDKNEAFFSIKYYSFTNEDYIKQKYLYKNRFLINSTKIKFLFNKSKYILNWDKVKLMKLKEDKGEIKIDYYLKINNQSSKDIYYNNGLFTNYDKFNNFNYGIHLINKNEYELSKNLIYKGNLVIYLIAKFNEINGMENFVVYEPLFLSEKNIYENNNGNNKVGKNRKNNTFLKVIILILIIIIIIFIIFYSYKLIRRIQIKSLYDKFMKENDKNLTLYDKEKINTSKISFLIEK